MRIALDAMGGDYAPAETVKGALVAAAAGLEIALVGPPASIEMELARYGRYPAGISVVPASQVIAMDEHPALAVRQKTDSSLSVGLRLVKSGEAAAFVSAGNTGAVMAAALFILGRIEGVERPALGGVLPSATNTPVLLLDIGANADCKPAWLLQFAQMGSAYLERTFQVRTPRVALLNIGEEEGKGNQLAREAHALLKRSGLNFIGNIEGKDIPRGLADVVVTDGFTGNVLLKTAEGVVDYVVAELRAAMTSRPHYKLAAAVLRPAFRRVARRLDYREYGGVPLLGVNGVVIIAHGRSNARAIASALRVAEQAVSGGMREALQGLSTTRQG